MSRLELDVVIIEAKRAAAAVTAAQQKITGAPCLQLPLTVTCESHTAVRRTEKSVLALIELANEQQVTTGDIQYMEPLKGSCKVINVQEMFGNEHEQVARFLLQRTKRHSYDSNCMLGFRTATNTNRLIERPR